MGVLNCHLKYNSTFRIRYHFRYSYIMPKLISLMITKSFQHLCLSVGNFDVSPYLQKGVAISLWKKYQL